jgi:DNA-binding transcriptional ArsR family regulator
VPFPLDEHRDRAFHDRVFHALSDATRRDIVSVTLHEEQSVSALARRYPMSFAAVQKHVAVLERAGVVVKRRQGREQLVRAEISAVQRAQHVLDHFEQLWRSRMDRIDALLDETTPVHDPTPDTRGPQP